MQLFIKPEIEKNKNKTWPFEINYFSIKHRKENWKIEKK